MRNNHGEDKIFLLFWAVILFGVAVWAGIFYIGYKVLNHFNIL